MSALAQILFDQKKIISGSDKHQSEITEKLEKKGIQILTKQKAENITPTIDLVVFSNAISDLNPELQSARQKNIPAITLSEAIGQFSDTKKTIAVCGTHGKSTTTALCAVALTATNTDPTVSIGTKLKEFEYNNFRSGKSDIFLAEACEYKRAFLNLNPEIIIITNIEPDHLDYFESPQDYFSAYKELIDRLPENGIIIANEDDPNTKQITSNTDRKIIYYSTKSPEAEKLNLSIPGKHNLSNAVAALSLSKALNLNEATTIEALNSFQGSWRRFEIKGKLNKTTVIDDYAHHPTEIIATIQATKEKFGPDSKICAVFQPHQHNRTHNLIDQFKTAFNGTKTLIIPNIYSVRDSKLDKQKISTETLINQISENHPHVINGQSLAKTTELLKETYNEYDVILIMGAGDVTQIANDLTSTD